NDRVQKLSSPGLTERAKRKVGRMRLVLQPGAQLGQAASGADPQGLRGGSRMVLLGLEGGSSAGQGPVAARSGGSGNANQWGVPVNSGAAVAGAGEPTAHRRRLAYEEAIRIPLLLRYPRRVKPGTVHEPLVLSIDLAPTVLELAGVP